MERRQPNLTYLDKVIAETEAKIASTFGDERAFYIQASESLNNVKRMLSIHSIALKLFSCRR